MDHTHNTIDFVVPFVDGSDPAWAEKRSRYTQDKEGDSRNIRFRSWDNLKYWFRAVEAFAPWVHKVYFVSDNQVPDWLNRDYEKLVIVDHQDFIPHEYLPVFNSHPIELNLHRIEGLSEQFVYFNDDTFLLRPVKETDFFRDGLPCDFAVEAPLIAHDRMFGHVIMNNIILLNESYWRKDVLREHRKKFYTFKNLRGTIKNIIMRTKRVNLFFGFLNDHMPNSFLKATFKDVWEKHYDVLDATCHHRFRDHEDVNQYVFIQNQYANGMFAPYNWKGQRRFYRVKNYEIDEIADDIRHQKFAMVCINEAKDIDFDYAKEVINGAWEKLLPDKSKFEV